MNDYFVVNLETGKLELHFDKAAYDELTDAQKSDIKSNFLWGKKTGCWISRAKEPNLWQARRCAESLGLEDAGKKGERLSFAEQMEQKAERAQRRADRCEARAEAAEQRGEALQKPITDRHGDIAFFTQPNINSSAGRAFTRRRERMFAAFEKGFDELRKSSYWKNRASIARSTAAQSELQDKGFLCRRIAERESDIRKLKRNILECEEIVQAYERGETPRNHFGEPVNVDAVNRQLEIWLDRLEVKLDELGFYQDCMDKLGGVAFGRNNLKPGDLVYISRWKEPVRFLHGGPKNFTYEFTAAHMVYASGKPMQGQAAYAEILRRTDSAERDDAGFFITLDEFAEIVSE